MVRLSMTLLSVETMLEEENFPAQLGVAVTSGAIKYSLPPIKSTDLAYRRMKSPDVPEDRRYFLFVKDDIMTYTVNRKQEGVTPSGKKWWSWQRLITLSFSFRPRGNSNEPKVNIYLSQITYAGYRSGIRNITSDPSLLGTLISVEHLDFVIQKFNEMYETLIGNLPEVDLTKVADKKALWFSAIVYPMSNKFNITSIPPNLTLAMREKTMKDFSHKLFGYSSQELEELLSNSPLDKIRWAVNFSKYVPQDVLVDFFKSSSTRANYPRVAENEYGNFRQVIKACDVETRQKLIHDLSSPLINLSILEDWATLRGYVRQDKKREKISADSWSNLGEIFSFMMLNVRREARERDTRISDDNFVKIVKYFLRDSHLKVDQLRANNFTLTVAPNLNKISFTNLIKFSYRKDFNIKNQIQFDDELKSFNDIFVNLGEEWQKEDNNYTKLQTLEYMKQIASLAENYLVENHVKPTRANVIKWVELIFFFISTKERRHVNLSTGIFKRFPKIFYWFIKNDFPISQTIILWSAKADRKLALIFKDAPFEWVEAGLNARPVNNFYTGMPDSNHSTDPFF